MNQIYPTTQSRSLSTLLFGAMLLVALLLAIAVLFYDSGSPDWADDRTTAFPVDAAIARFTSIPSTPVPNPNPQLPNGAPCCRAPAASCATHGGWPHSRDWPS